MLPVVIPVGWFSVYTVNVLLVLAWLIFSFQFWRGMRRWGVEEDRIFDLTFYSSIAALIGARFLYVITSWQLFEGKSWLLPLALWVLPGLSFPGGIMGGLLSIVSLSRSYKIRVGWVLDTLSMALPLPIIIGETASILGGMVTGKPGDVPWAVRYGDSGIPGHPVQLYMMIGMVFLTLVIARLSVISVRKKLPYGIVGMWFFLLYSVLWFVLEFFKDTPVYWGGLSANQWILIGVFAESVGVLYVRGGGKQKLRTVSRTVSSFIRKKGTSIYAAISKRNADRSS